MNELLRNAIAEQFNRSSHTAHGFDHVERTARLARYIAENESYDPEIAEVAGLLHDIGRTVQDEEKNHGPAGVAPASKLLDQFTTYSPDIKQQILNAIHDHSMLKTEGKLTHIVQDADMLDGLGAVGLTRTHTSKARLPVYDPEDKNITPTVGKRDVTIHEQLVFQMEYIDLMHTKTGHRIAVIRHKRTADFLEDFRTEVLGLDFIDDLSHV